MPEGLCKNSVADIARFVARGNSQSPANCRILLREIEHLRAAAREQQHRADQFLAASLKKQSPTIDSDTRYRIIRAIALALDGFDNDPQSIADQVITELASEKSICN